MESISTQNKFNMKIKRKPSIYTKKDVLHIVEGDNGSPNTKKNSFRDIRDYYNNLDSDNSHFVNSNDICTPIDCVKVMVDKIPTELWKRDNLKILDCCCGNGNFHAYISNKTDLNNLYFNEINEKRIQNLKSFFGENIKVTNRDFLSFEEKEEYDLVVSNPPYAKFDNNGKRVSKNHNLSRDFILKALKITKPGGYILFIVPNNWMSYADRNKLPKLLSRYQFIHLNIGGAKKYFPKIGSSFTWFILKKVPNREPFQVENHYIIKSTNKASLEKEVNYIPLNYNDTIRKIIKKTLNLKCKKYKIQTTSYLHKYTKKEHFNNTETKSHKYRIIHTPSQIVYSNKPHKFQKGYKVFISLTNQYETFIDNCGMTQSIAFILCKDKEEAIKIKKELKNEVFIFLNNIARYGNFNNIRILQEFPLLKFIKLTKRELLFVEKFNKTYYRSKNG